MSVQVSVVIPTYNQNPKFLSEAVESALRQTYPKNKYEILVVDDGSTLISPDQVMSKFKCEKQVKLIKKEHGGIAHTLNTGARHMQGQYFKWLSSDDALCEDGLEILISRAKSETEILYGDWMKIDENSNSMGVFHERAFENPSEMKLYLWRNFFGNATASLIPKSAFKKVGTFDASLPFYEDYDWWLRASFLHNYSFVHVGKVVAKYRFHETQNTKVLEKYVLDSMLSHWLIRRRVYLLLDKNSRQGLNPSPSITSFMSRLFSFRIARMYRKISGINQIGRARTPARLRQVAYKFLGVA